MTRLDQLLVAKGLFPSREQARRAVMAGLVEVDGRRVDKAGAATQPGAALRVLERSPFVSRGGEKLNHGLQAFEIDPTDWTCLDIGASTGGFTDCLLQHGAEKVYAIDVGYGQLDYRLRRDPRVVVRERINARHLDATHVQEECDLAVFDVSFISLRKVVPAVVSFVKPDGRLLALVKPQFEGRREQVGKGGVVRDPAVRESIIASTVSDLEASGLKLEAQTDSPIAGAKGNLEALALFSRSGEPS